MRLFSRSRPLLAALLLTALPGTAAAQYVWQGGGTNDNWSNGANWGGTAPPSSPTTTLTFDGTTNLTSTVDQPYTINSLTFGPNAGAYTVGGSSAITFGGSNPTLMMGGASPVAVNAPVVFSAGGTIGGTGAGTLTLADLSVATGTLSVNRDVTVGTLRLSADGGPVNSVVTINSGTNVITLTGDIVFNSSPGNQTAPPAALAGVVTLTAGSHKFVSLEQSSNFENAPYIDFTISAKLQDAGPQAAADFVKLGSSNANDRRAYLLLSNQNTYHGATILQANSQHTYLGVVNALPSTTALQVHNEADLYLTDNEAGTNGFAQTIGSLSDGGTTGGKVHLGPTVNTFVTSAVLTTGGDNTSTRFAGLIDAGGSLVKVGTGTFTLTGQNTYFGGTTVSAGALLVNGQTSGSGTGTGAVTVNTGGTFGGTGRAGDASTGPVTVNSGGTIRAGDASGVGTLTLRGGLTLGGGAKLGLRITDASVSSAAPGGSTVGTLPNPTSNNFLNAAGALTATATNIQVVIDGTGTTFTQSQPYSYRVGTFAGSDLSGFSVTDPSQFTTVGFDATGFAFSLSGNSAGGLFLNFTPVPEPGLALALAAGVGVVGLARRRRARA